MNFRRLVIPSANSMASWNVAPAAWRRATNDDVARAMLHRFFEASRAPFTSSTLAHDPFVGFMCDLIGANPVALSNLRLGIEISFLPSPRFQLIETKPISEEFRTQMANELLADQKISKSLEALRRGAGRFYALIELARITRIVAYLTVVLSGIELADPMRPFSLHGAPLSALIAGCVIFGSQVVTLRLIGNRGKIIDQLDAASVPAMVKLWHQAASASGLAYKKIRGTSFVGNQTHFHDFIVDEVNWLAIQEMMESAERGGLKEKAGQILYRAEVSSLTAQLGTTCAVLTVCAPQPVQSQDPDDPPSDSWRSPAPRRRFRKPTPAIAFVS